MDLDLLKKIANAEYFKDFNGNHVITPVSLLSIISFP